MKDNELYRYYYIHPLKAVARGIVCGENSFLPYNTEIFDPAENTWIEENEHMITDMIMDYGHYSSMDIDRISADLGEAVIAEQLRTRSRNVLKSNADLRSRMLAELRAHGTYFLDENEL